MSGSFGSGGLGSETVFPVEVTCNLVGDSTVTDVVTLIVQGAVTCAGNSTSAFSLVNEVGIACSMIGASTLGALASLVDVDYLTFMGDSDLVFDNTKIILKSTPRSPVLTGTAKPPTPPVIRINPPPVITHNISVGPGAATGRGPKTDKDPH